MKEMGSHYDVGSSTYSEKKHVFGTCVVLLSSTSEPVHIPRTPYLQSKASSSWVTLCSGESNAYFKSCSKPLPEEPVATYNNVCTWL